MMRISFQDVKQTTTAQGQTAPGQVAQTPDGASWIYVQATEAVAKGNVVVPIAAVGVDKLRTL